MNEFETPNLAAYLEHSSRNNDTTDGTPNPLVGGNSSKHAERILQAFVLLRWQENNVFEIYFAR